MILDRDRVAQLILSREPLGPETVQRLLAPYRFADPLRVDRELQALADLSPSRDRLARILDRLLAAAARSPDPDAALHRFHTYVQARGETSILYEQLERIAGLMEDLLFVFGASEYLAAVLIRNPHYLEWVLEQNARDVSKSRAEMEAELRDWVGRFRTPESQEGVLRQFKRRESFRIGMRDLLGLASVEETIREMADLADAALQVALELVQRRAGERYGRPTGPDGSPVGFAVIGMGKLGGRELNFSSDIDLLCVYGEEGKTTQGLENQTYFARLTEELVRVLGQHQPEGYVFRVDLRLRPQGSSGAVARSLDSYVGYYETWGELFDRQALLKARPAAGDQELGAAFVRALEPFVYQPVGSEEDVQITLEELLHTKRQIERKIAQEGDPALHVKLGPGGIRDVEFVVQALQLLHGGHDPTVRVRGTLPAIDALERGGYLDCADAQKLRDGYRFHRRVENMIQLVADRQQYTLPDDPEEWERMARRLGYADAPDCSASDRLRADYEHHRQAVREVFERVFAVEPDPFRDRISEIVEETGPLSPEAESFLRQYGLDNPSDAARWLRELAHGSARVRFTPRVRRRFLRFARPLFEELAKTPDPDLALNQLARFLDASHSRAQIYAVLEEHRPVLELLVRILGTSRFLGEILIRDPVLFEQLTYASTIAERVEAVELFQERLLRATANEREPLRAVQRFRLGELLRIGTRDLLGLSTLGETTYELSLLAEAILKFYAERLFQRLVEQYGPPRAEDGSPVTFVIVGMGKLAGRELNYSSDLDVQVIYSAEGRTPQGLGNAEFFHRLVRTLVSDFKRPILGGAIYELDLRLRPYGRGGPMALPLDAYARYFAEKAELWERQAHLRARPVAGDSQLGQRFAALAESFAYRAPLTAQEAEAIYQVRSRKEEKAARETDRLHNLKSGYGGLVDIEFLIQALQLRYGPDDPHVRTANTPEAIERLAERGYLDKESATALQEAYRFFRFLEDRLQIVDQRPLSALPTDPAARDKLARRMGYVADGQSPSQQLLDDYHATTQNVREIFEATFARLRERSSE